MLWTLKCCVGANCSDSWGVLAVSLLCAAVFAADLDPAPLVISTVRATVDPAGQSNELRRALRL